MLFNFFNWKQQLLGYADVKIGGTRFTIRKLAPADFMDNPALLPFTNISGVEGAKASEPPQVVIDKHKGEVKKIILKGTVNPEIDVSDKKNPHKLHIDEIMATQVLYNMLCSAILMHTFGGIKKKVLRRFGSTETLPAFCSR